MRTSAHRMITQQQDVDGARQAYSLPTFLQTTFSGTCNIHNTDIKRYCALCNVAACKECIALGPHKDHYALTINKLVRSDAVQKDQMQALADFSNIQELQDVCWVDQFLTSTFFKACPAHKRMHKNDQKKYCINCNIAICKHCIAAGTHEGHEFLKIYRHVHKDVVPLEEMEQHMDCSRIQPYRCNQQLVLALYPLPHCRSGESRQHIACRFCKRKLMHPRRYRFCSIACKYQIIDTSASSAQPPANPPAADEGDDPTGTEKSLRRHRRKRKPVRSNLF